MVYHFIMLSDEVENFRRGYELDSDATFLDLYNIIYDSVDYKKGEMASFFICGNNWSKETEITLVEMDTRSEYDAIIMADTRLSDYLEDERQRLMLVFDYLYDRAFYMELREITFGESLDEPVISKSVGIAPIQFMPVEEETPKVMVAPVVAPALSDGDDFDEDEDDFAVEHYGEHDYNEDELDMDGFGDEGEEGDIETNTEELEI